MTDRHDLNIYADTPWLTLPLAQKRARCGRRTILEALADETLRGYQVTKPNGTWRIHRDDLDAWIRGETVAPPTVTRRRAS